MNRPIKVLVVDNDEVFHHRVCEVLESTESITIAGWAQNSREAMALARELQPDVILVDIGTSPENLRTVAQISKSFPDVRIVVLNEDGQEQQVLDALRLGALGHLSRESAQSTKLVHAICAASRREAILSPDVAGHILDEVARERNRGES